MFDVRILGLAVWRLLLKPTRYVMLRYVMLMKYRRLLPAPVRVAGVRYKGTATCVYDGTAGVRSHALQTRDSGAQRLHSYRFVVTAFRAAPCVRLRLPRPK
jgi:hypothetical protein